VGDLLSLGVFFSPNWGPCFPERPPGVCANERRLAAAFYGSAVSCWRCLACLHFAALQADTVWPILGRRLGRNAPGRKCEGAEQKWTQWCFWAPSRGYIIWRN